MPSLRSFAITLLASGTAVAASQLRAQDGKTYLTVLGRDTLSIEQFTRSGNTITGDIIQRQGGTIVSHYVARLGPDGAPASLEVTQRRPDGSMIPNGIKSISATRGADTTVIVIMRDTAITRRIAVRDAFLAFGNSHALYEVAFVKLRAMKKDSLPLQLLPVGAQRAPAPLQVKFFAPDTARVWNSVFPTYYVVDAEGGVHGSSGRETTFKTETRHVDAVNIAAMASAFAAAEATGKPAVSTASARDTVNASVGRARVWVDYGRPVARGREVFKNGVLNDTLWRTGANQATQFRSDVDLVIGGKTLPAGIYTLWTAVPANNSSYTLVFNSQTGQWGTVHDAAKDVIRVPLTVSKLASPAEVFTIQVESASNGGTIKLQWTSTQLAVPFTVK